MSLGIRLHFVIYVNIPVVPALFVKNIFPFIELSWQPCWKLIYYISGFSILFWWFTCIYLTLLTTFVCKYFLIFNSLSSWVSLFLLSESSFPYPYIHSLKDSSFKVFPVHVHTFSMLWLSSPSQDRCTLNSLSDLPCFLFLHSFWWIAMPIGLWNFSSLSKGIEPDLQLGKENELSPLDRQEFLSHS